MLFIAFKKKPLIDLCVHVMVKKWRVLNGLDIVYRKIVIFKSMKSKRIGGKEGDILYSYLREAFQHTEW